MVRQRLSSGITPQRLSFGNTPAVPMSSTKKKYSAKPGAKSSAEDAPAGKTLKTSAKRKRKINWAELNDSNFGGFEVHTATIKPSKKLPTKKQKTDAPGDRNARDDAPTNADTLQLNPFDGVDLSATYHVIKPVAEWESMKRYKNFTLADELFQVGQNVWVKTANDQGDEEAATLEVARILEVRAGDAAHVYLRIYWMYKPENLPYGRQHFHGECELIASNHMDVIEATNVEDKADVVYWDNETSWRPEEGQYFFRQTLDVVKGKGKQLSNLKRYCVDQAPSNPDEPLIQCPSCSEWLHGHCLEEQAVEDAGQENTSDEVQKKAPGRPKKGDNSSSAPTLEAKIGITKSGKTQLTLTDKRPDQDSRQWHVDIKCLSCDAIIEKFIEEKEAEEKDEDMEEAAVPKDNQNDDDNTITVTSKSKASKASDKEPQTKTTTTSTVSSPQTAQPHSAPTQSSSKAKQSKSQTTHTSDIAKSPTDTAPKSDARKRKRAVSNSLIIGSTETPVSVAEDPDASVLQSGIQSVKRLLWRST